VHVLYSGYLSLYDRFTFSIISFSLIFYSAFQLKNVKLHVFKSSHCGFQRILVLNTKQIQTKYFKIIREQVMSVEIFMLLFLCIKSNCKNTDL